jgi:asparagine synthase (glutamine-hydrolysing)
VSDILIAAGLDCDAGALAQQLSWTPQTKAWTGLAGGLTWVVTRVDAPELWAPAYDRQSGVRALIGGRIAPEEAEWKAAEALPYEGGLACRIVIDRWLKGGAAAVERLNGGAQIIVIDERKRELHVWTDRMGFYPAFAWTDGGFLLCSHPDVAATALEAAGRPCDFDPVTMAEFLRTGTSVHPHTYWHGIRHMDAGTRFRFTFGDAPRLAESATYWRPAYLEGEPYLTDRREIVDRLATALKSAVQRRTLPRLGKVAVLLSAGADSRTALFGACAPSKVTCYTLYDEPNAELAGAEALASTAGAVHRTLQRSKDYYIQHAPAAVRVSGGMWSVDAAAFGGVCEAIKQDEAGTVLTGCYTDYLLKGLAYNRRHREIFGRSLPVYALDRPSYQFYQPFAAIAPNWATVVEARLESHYGKLPGGAHHPASGAEFIRLSPIAREADAAGRLFLRRTVPVDYFTADNAVIELAAAIHPAEKVSGIAFGMAVEQVTGPRANHILNNNYHARVGASEVGRVAAFVLASLKRKLSRQGGGQPFEDDPQSVATVGSWPNHGRVIKLAPGLKTWRESISKDQKELLFGMIGQERRDWSLDQWGDQDPSLFYRLYTASLWLSQNTRVLARGITL